MTRQPIVGGNWKMHTTRDAAHALARAVINGAGELTDSCEVVIFPPFPYLATVREIASGSPIALGAQNVYPERHGAFTGEVGIDMLLDLSVTHVLIGHSERRHVIGECDEMIQKKFRAALDAGLNAVFCIGETLVQREAGQTERVNLQQLESGFKGIAADQLERVVIAYEPVWAIGTGRTATPDDAQTVHRVIRQWVEECYTEKKAESIRIQYGGSVKPDNAASLIAQPDVDGFLVGGASLNGSDFLAIVGTAAQAHPTKQPHTGRAC